MASRRLPDSLARAASAAKALERRKLRDCFSWENLDSRPTTAQLVVLRAAKDVLIRIVRAGNQSGKTATGGRDVSWILNREHPFLDVTKTWGSGKPLLAIVAGQDRLQVENKLWKATLKPLLTDPSEWREHRPSGVLVSAENKRTGDTIIFLSHNNSSPDDIKHMQSYDAHVVWLDEMPKNPAVLEELTRRIDARRGRLMATFTQKVRNDAVRKAVDGLDPSVARTFRLNKLDNPLYADRREEEVAKLSHLSPELRAAIESGDWIMSSTRIYAVDRERVGGEPAGYNPSWPHVAVVDPATESKCGRLVVAASPETTSSGERVWWVVQADYVEGVYVPSRIVTAVEAPLRSINVIKRVYDTAASWFFHQARAMGFRYYAVPEKSYSKQTWIAKTQEALGGTLRIADWCSAAFEELESCERSETNPDKIANAHRFHLIDCIHYFLATKPVDPPPAKVYENYWQWLHEQNAIRMKLDAGRQRTKRRTKRWM